MLNYENNHQLQTPFVWEYVHYYGAFPAELFQGNSHKDEEDGSASPADDPMDDDETPFQHTRNDSLKKHSSSDYSSLEYVRTGRWSKEEEHYANAMIEAFKSGILPLPGTMSLRKFLSEILRCHPMRVSKKFVGYVRKVRFICYRIIFL